MKPFYDDGRCVIYHGDCRDILPSLSGNLVLTDPPYGVGLDYASYDDTREAWRLLIDAVIPMARRAATMVIMPAGPMDELKWIYAHHAPDWLLCWYKGSPGTLSRVGFNDWEPLLVYGKNPGVQMHDYLYVAPEPFTNGHPCPKPLAWGRWLVSRALPRSGVVIDPFMGSGTILRAAIDLGHRAIGIEIEERYCEIAATRLSQQTLALA